MEYWIEENVRPINDGDFDNVLFANMRPLISHMKNQRWVVYWHFLRESENWRGSNNQLILHIRLRVCVNETNLQIARTYLSTELDSLRTQAIISDHYRGNHGNPNQEYNGEAANFDENSVNPEGWKITQKWLEVGSEIEMVFLKNGFQGCVLGNRFVLPDLLHFVANQCGKQNVLLQPAHQFVIQI